MDKIELHELGEFSVNYDGPILDLISVARFQFSLHQLFEKIALKTLLDNEVSRVHLYSEFDPIFLRSIGSRRIGYRNLPKIIAPSSAFRPLSEVEEFMTLEPLIFMNVKRVNVGSWYQDLAVATVALLANQDVRNVLTSLGANLIYALINSGIENVRKSDEPNYTAPHDVPHDPFDVGENILEIIKTLSESGRSDARSVTITHTKEGRTSEVQIKLRR